MSNGECPDISSSDYDDFKEREYIAQLRRSKLSYGDLVLLLAIEKVSTDILKWALEGKDEQIADLEAWQREAVAHDKEAAEKLEHLKQLYDRALVLEIRGSRIAMAKKGAQARLEKDPKQIAKANAKELWRKWQDGMVIFKSGAAFGRHIVSTMPDIESPTVVERWVTAWRRERKSTHHAS